MILVRPAPTDPAEDDPRPRSDWTGTEVLLSAAADPDRWVAAIGTPPPTGCPWSSRGWHASKLGAVVVRLARLAPDLGLAAVVVTAGHDPYTPAPPSPRCPGGNACGRPADRATPSEPPNYHRNRPRGPRTMTTTAEHPPRPTRPPRPSTSLALVWLDPRELADHRRNVRHDLGALAASRPASARTERSSRCQ